MRGRSWILGLLGAAVILVVVGTVILLFSPATIGWFGYSPLSSTTSFAFVGGAYPITAERAAGLACVGAGLLLISAVAGWVLGRRSAFRAVGRDGQPMSSEE